MAIKTAPCKICGDIAPLLAFAAGKFLVRSSNGETYYLVDVHKGTCDCPDYVHRAGDSRYQCKHLRAAISSKTRRKQ